MKIKKYHTCGRCKYENTPDDKYPCVSCIYGTGYGADLWERKSEDIPIEQVKHKETVEVVVKLPKEVYEKIQQVDRIISGRRNGKTIEFALWNGVKNGTVLPKGHGRLYDLDAALKCMEEVADNKSKIKECAMGFFDWACSKRVVLEADTESEEN